MPAMCVAVCVPCVPMFIVLLSARRTLIADVNIVASGRQVVTRLYPSAML